MEIRLEWKNLIRNFKCWVHCEIVRILIGQIRVEEFHVTSIVKSMCIYEVVDTMNSNIDSHSDKFTYSRTINFYLYCLSLVIMNHLINLSNKFILSFSKHSSFDQIWQQTLLMITIISIEFETKLILLLNNISINTLNSVQFDETILCFYLIEIDFNIWQQNTDIYQLRR